MKKLSALFFVAALSLGLSACSKGGSGGGGASCDQVVAKMSDMIGKQMAGSVPADKKELADKFMTKTKGVMLAACTEDKWPAELRQCVVDAKDEAALQACNEKGGKEVEAKMQERMKPVMEELMKEMMGAAAGGAGGAMPAEGAAPAAPAEGAAAPAEGAAPAAPAEGAAPAEAK